MDADAIDDADAEDFDAVPYPLPNPTGINGRLRALARINHELAEYDAAAQTELSEVEERVIERRRPLAARATWLREALELDHRAALAADPKRTSITLPAGSLTSRAGGVEWQYQDEAALLDWVKANAPAAYNQPPAPAPRLDKNALKTALKPDAIDDQKSGQKPKRDDGTVVTADGELVPGLLVVEKPRTFDVKVAES